MAKYRNKTIKFNMENEADKELWDYLQGLPHGLFSSHTKEMWEETKSMRSTTEKYYKDEPIPVVVQKFTLPTEGTADAIKKERVNRMNGGKIGE